jgi:hypothetical protein
LKTQPENSFSGGAAASPSEKLYTLTKEGEHNDQAMQVELPHYAIIQAVDRRGTEVEARPMTEQRRSTCSLAKGESKQIEGRD